MNAAAKTLFASQTEPTFDINDALARVQGDRELLGELVVMLQAECPLRFLEITRCVDAGDTAGLERAAHRLRGSLGVFGARTAAQTALELELMGRKGALSGASSKLAELKQELNRLDRDLSTFNEDPAA